LNGYLTVFVLEKRWFLRNDVNHLRILDMSVSSVGLDG
jgi:hypothetical protein